MPQSEKKDSRVEEKLDLILRTLRPVDANDHIDALNRRFPGRDAGTKL